MGENSQPCFAVSPRAASLLDVGRMKIHVPIIVAKAESNRYTWEILKTSVRKPALLAGACCITATRGHSYLSITMKTKTNGGRFTTCARCTLKHNYNNSWPWAESNRQTSVYILHKE